MITRWRLEAEKETVEDVEDAIESATQAMLGHLRDTQPGDKWECTDDICIPRESANGEAVIYGRRVFRRMEAESYGD